MTDADIDAEALAVLAARIARHRATRGPAHKGLLGRLGARLITGASNDDPSGIATYKGAVRLCDVLNDAVLLPHDSGDPGD